MFCRQRKMDNWNSNFIPRFFDRLTVYIYYSFLVGFNLSSSTAFSGSSGLTTESSYLASTPWCLNCSMTTVTNSIISPNQTRIQSDRTEYYMPSSITTVVSPSRHVIDYTTKPPQRLPPGPAQLTSFGIFLLTFGAVLIAFMIISLIWICCGRERR